VGNGESAAGGRGGGRIENRLSSLALVDVRLNLLQSLWRIDSAWVGRASRDVESLGWSSEKHQTDNEICSVGFAGWRLPEPPVRIWGSRPRSRDS